MSGADKGPAEGAPRESVWDYPRPPRLEPVGARLRVAFDGETIAETTSGYRVLETSHPPNYYFPPQDIRPGALAPAAGGSVCEWKGAAVYFDIAGPTRRALKAAWSYPRPTIPFQAIAGYVAFYAGPMDACYVESECAEPQPGGFYGGWITSNIAGPFKGGPGTMGW